MGLFVLVAVLGMILWTFRVVFPPLIFAGAIVFILNPLVTMLARRGIPRAVGAAVAYLGIVGLIALAALALAPLVSDQADQFRDEWPAIRDDVEEWVDERAEDSQGTAFEFTRQELEDSLTDNDLTVREQIDRLQDVGARVFHVLLILVLGPVIAFYLLVDLPHIRRVAESLVPASAHAEVMVVASRLNRAIGGFFRGQLFVALIVGILCSIGLFAIGLRFWLLIGLVAGLFNIIPLVGPWIGGIPGMLVALTTGDLGQALGVVVVMVAAQQIDNHFITPYVMQRAVKLHPAAVILALLAGGTIGGFAGLLLAVPTAAVLKIVLGHLWRVHVLGEPVEELARDAEAADTGPGGFVDDVVSIEA